MTDQILDEEKKYTCKELFKEDLPEILEIERKSFPHPWSAKSFIQMFEQKSYEAFGLFDDKGLLGYCFFYWVIDEINIVNIATDPARRQERVGSTLLRFVEDWARSKNLRKSFLEVSVSNESAIALYQKFDYVKQARRLKYYVDGDDALIMVKKL